MVIIAEASYRDSPGVLRAQLEGIHETADIYGMQVRTIRCTGPYDGPSSAIRSDVRGVILMGLPASQAIRHQPGTLPIISFGNDPNDPSDKVMDNNDHIGQLAADYLLRRGHRQLGFLCAMFDKNGYQLRAESFEIAARRQQAPVTRFTDAQPIEITDEAQVARTLREAIDYLVEQLAHHQPPIRGLFVPNDMMTAMVYAALQRRGLEPGRDLDVISCNNERAYLLPLKPQPATIDIGAVTMGRRGVEQLVWRMDHLNHARTVQTVVKPVLVEAEPW
ncbi:MAG: LacI family DNA-binding transcriptional regulator [Phycisphaeraceae bacterium]|nr:LacI family DNA-binding transcriptional regulator [Phycisphaeraceae bacterium]